MTRLYIPVMNRLDLLEGALETIGAHFSEVWIIDNTAEELQEAVCKFEEEDKTGRVVVWRPSIQYRFVDTMNLMQALSKRHRLTEYYWCHNDARDNTPGGEHTLKFIEFVHALVQSTDLWSVAFTHYDILSAVNMEAVQAVGPWDNVLSQYYADNDWYRRCRLAGYPTVDSGLHIEHMNDASNTMKADPYYAFTSLLTNGMYAWYYMQKWGAPPPNETFTIPFEDRRAKS